MKDTLLRYHHLYNFDKAMQELEEQYGWLHSPQVGSALLFVECFVGLTKARPMFPVSMKMTKLLLLNELVCSLLSISIRLKVSLTTDLGLILQEGTFAMHHPHRQLCVGINWFCNRIVRSLGATTDWMKMLTTSLNPNPGMIDDIQFWYGVLCF